MKKAIVGAIVAAALLGLVVAILKLPMDAEPSVATTTGEKSPVVSVPPPPSTSTPAVTATGHPVATGMAAAPTAASNPQAVAVRAMLEGATPDDWEPLLMKLVENGDSNTVAALAQAMGTETNVHQLTLISRVLNGIGTEESLQVFIDFLSDEKNMSYREHLAGTLLALENEELAGTVLDWMLKTMDYDITMACQEAVGRLATGEVVERIIAEHSQTNCNEYVLELMRTALENSECPEAIDLFRKELESPSGRPSLALQSSVAQALARIGTQPAIDVLIAALEKSTRNPTNDFLVEAVASLHTSYMQAYLQELFDRTQSPNVKYALGRVLAETIPMLKDYNEEPPPGEEEIPVLPEDEMGDGALVPLQVGGDEGEWEEFPEGESDGTTDEEWDADEFSIEPDEGAPTVPQEEMHVD